MQVEQRLKNRANRLTTMGPDDIIDEVNRMLMLHAGGTYLNG